MAIEPKYTEQMPFVSTATQRERVNSEAIRRRTSMAEVIRDAVDQRYGLVNGEEPEGQATVNDTPPDGSKRTRT